MPKPVIPGGYILLSRKIIGSEIMKKPPMYLKVWAWLLLNAQRGPYKGLSRGQLVTSIPEIQDAMTYKVGFRVVRPSKKEVWGILNWLRRSCAQPCEHPHEGNAEGGEELPMIETTKVTQKLLINIVKYDLYQSPKNYEGNAEGNGKLPTKVTPEEETGEQYKQEDINKNTNKNIILSVFTHWNAKKIIRHRELTKALSSSINARLDKYPAELIMDAIDNYATVLHGDEYFFSYKWPLDEFIKPKNLDRFLAESKPLINFLKEKPKQSEHRPNVARALKLVEKYKGEGEEP